MSEFRRWYDNDPVLKEALELLSISAEDVKDESATFLMNLQDQVAKDVIERLYEQIQDYQLNGNRWYDKDPVMLKAIELLRVAPANVQRQAARKLLKALSKDAPEEAEEL